MKNHALSKQLSEIRQALNALGKAIGAKGINVPEVQKIQKDGKKKKHGKRRRSRGRHSSSYPSGVYTVKNVRSLNVDNGYACKTYDQFHGKKHFSTTPHMEEREYKIKLFGNGRSAEVVSGSFRNFTNKRGKSSCISSSGCSV
jgi:hypothetical protein